MKSFDELAQAAFFAYEKSSSRNYDEQHSRQDWQRLNPELQAHWLAVAKELAAQIAVIY